MRNSPKTRRFRFGVLLASFVLVLASARGVERVVLQLPYLHQFQFAGVYAAQSQGYFAEAGLEVEVREAAGEHRSAVQEVAAGRAHFGIAQSHQIIAQRLRGQQLTVVAAIMQHSPLVLLTRAEDNLNTPHDLIGRRVALDQTALDSEIRQMLEREGVSLDRLTIVPNDWTEDELRTGAAEAMSGFILDTPLASKRAGVSVRIMRPLDYGVDFYGDCLFTSERVLAEAPDVVARLRAALLRGWQHALQHPQEIIEDLAAGHPATRLDREALRYEARQVALLVNADLVELGRINPGRWMQMAGSIQGYLGEGDTARLEGMLYDPAPGWAERLRGHASLLVWGSLIALGLAGAVLFTNRRLQRIVERRTGELREAQRRQRELFEQAPAPITHNDYSAVAGRLNALRARGVTDLPAELCAQPALLDELCALVRVTDGNRLALAAGGVDSVAELDRRRLAMHTSASKETFRQELQAIWDNRPELRLEKSYETAGGKIRHGLISWSAQLVDGRPNYARVQLVFTDVTEQKDTEAALRESEERYRRLFETTPNPTYIYDAETLRFVMVNQVMVERYGYSREELMRMAVTDIRPAEEAERLRGYMATFSALEVKPSEAHAAGLWRHRRKDGTILLVEVYTHSLTLNGRLCVLVLPFDVTTKLAAERALRESETRYRELFEHAVGGIYRSTPDGRFIAVNPALARMLGFESAADMIAWSGQHMLASLYVQAGRREEFVRQFRVLDRVVDFESEVRRRDGTTLWVAENVRAIRDAAGQLLHFEGFVTDITARRRLEAEMTRASKLEAVGILAGGIAHDFNNILTVVLGNVTLAEMDAGANAELRRMLRDTKQATLRARDLTQQLLTFAKGGDPVRAAVALPELLRESAGFALHGSKARAEFEFAADLHPVNADKGQIGQVIQNLVINSVQAMPQGGIVRVTAANDCLVAGAVGGLAAGEYVRIGVVDTGVGIPPEHLAKIFDPYFTTKQQGSGLGLATVYSIMRKHQGHIEVESRLGHGTSFHLWLPVAPTLPEPPAPEPTPAPAVTARVLFMDDEAPILDMARMFLTRLGMECVTAMDGVDAVEKYRAAREMGRPFDVVVMDLTVPGGMGGREALEHLRRLDPEVRAIVSSGYSRDPVLANYRAHGFCGILPKPYGLDQLQKALLDVVRQRQSAAPF